MEILAVMVKFMLQVLSCTLGILLASWLIDVIQQVKNEYRSRRGRW